jgi:hypothetical protein
MRRVHVLIWFAAWISVTPATANPVSSFERANVFAIGPISDGAETSDEERALRALLKRPHASEELSELLHSASPAGQLYALLGLRLCDRYAFERALSDFLHRDDIVTTMTGCILDEERVAAVAQRIAKGDYDQTMQRPPR